MTSVVIPNSVTNIIIDAFCECDSLTSVEIPDSVTLIGSGAFRLCENLTSVKIGNGVTSIGDDVLRGCDSLISIVIPDGVISIGSYAVSYCDSLTSVVIGDSVTSIKYGAFTNCTNLTDVTLKNQIPVNYQALFFGCIALAKIYVPYGCADVYKTKWAADGADQAILDLIVESDREANMSDINALKSEIQAELIGKTDYLGTVAAMADLETTAGAGDYHRASVEFIFDEATGETAHIGDLLIAIVDNPAQTTSDWDLIHTELGAAPATSEDINSIFTEA